MHSRKLRKGGVENSGHEKVATFARRDSLGKEEASFRSEKVVSPMVIARK